MVVVFDDADVLVETEDGTSQEERLGHVVEQPCGHVFNLDDLVGYEGDTAHDEQHRYASVSARNNNTLTEKIS